MPTDSDSKELARREIGWRRASTDPHWLAESAWMIQHPLGDRLFDLRKAQSEALTRWVAGENSITLKARQIGWSTLIGFYVFWLAFFRPNTRIMLLSKGEREAQELLSKVRFGAERIPSWLAARGPKIKTSNLQKLEFTNGSEILSLPSGNNPARGFTGRLVVCDEFAFLENSDEAWASIEPTADIGGQLIILSTANGSGNKFEDLWARAETGKSVFKPMFYGWWAVPERDAAWYEQKQFDLPEWQLNQEYPDNAREAFIKSGMLVFNSKLLDEMAKATTEPVWRGMLAATGPSPKAFEPSENPNGFVSVWEFPEVVGSYVAGVDVAEGLAHGDYSSVHVLRIDGDEPRIVATWHGHIEADLLAVEVARLGWWFNSALVFPEVNNHGLTTVTELRKCGYKRIWRRMAVNVATRKRSLEWGWKTTRVTKPLMIDQLGQFMRENPSAVSSSQTVAELSRYVRDARGLMSGSPHDDRVVSYALAVQAIQYAYLPDFQEEVRVPYGSWDWYDQLIRDAEGEASVDDEWVIA